MMTGTRDSLNVLVVDDNDDAAMTMALLLKHSGHRAKVACGGEAALAVAPSFHPDVVFVDLAMPQIDGLTVARRLRQTAEFAETPLVAVSGYVDADEQARAKEAGFDEFLPKPYGLPLLMETLDRVRARAAQSRQRVSQALLLAEQTRRLNEISRQSLDDFWQRRQGAAREQFAVAIEKSGISNIITLTVRGAAEELRRWLKDQRCRVGPVFEPAVGQFAFFVYIRRQVIGELIAKNGRFRVEPKKR